MKIEKVIAQEVLEMSVGEDTLNWKVGQDIDYPVKFKMVQTKIIDTSRWSIIHEVVYLDLTTGKYWRSIYSVGATEYQDESAYEYDGDEIELTEVIPVEHTVIKYEVIK